MKQGKEICKTLKAIRNEIACANDIDYTSTPCTHKGDCAGTCPMCESETRWLERQLRLRQSLGRAVSIAGVSLALSVAASAATPPTLGVEQEKKQQTRTSKSQKSPNAPKTSTNNKDNGREWRTAGVVLPKKSYGKGFPYRKPEGPGRSSGRSSGNSSGRSSGNGSGRGGRSVRPSKYIFSPDSIFTYPDLEASYPGGDEAMLALIKERINIPPKTLKSLKKQHGNIDALCVVKCVIEADGSMGETKIEKSTSIPALDDEALRVVKSLPKFTPAQVGNIPVRSWMIIPVVFNYKK